MMDFSFLRERRLIFQKAVEVPQPLSQRIADFMRRNGDDRELEELVQNVREVPEKQTVLDGALQQLQTFEEKERQAITVNLDSLQERIVGKMKMHERVLAQGAVRSWLDRARQALAGKESGIPSATAPENPAKTVPATPGQMAMNFAEGVTNTVLPTRVTENMTPAQKRVFGGAVTVGAALIAGWVAYGLIKGKEAGQKQEGGILRKAMWGMLIGGATIIGGAHLADFLIERYGKQLIPGKMLDAANKKIETVSAKVTELGWKGQPWEKYGLDETTYEKAKDIFSRWGKSGEVEIKNLFGEENKEGHQKFIEDMEIEIGREKDEKGIAFVRPPVALLNYEKNLENGLRSMRLWIDNHKTEVVLGTLLATRLGILRAALDGTRAIGTMSLETANLLRRWVQRNPLISLLLLGGTALGAFELIRASRKTRLPENLAELAKACAKGSSLLMGEGEEIGKDVLETLRTYGAEVAIIGENFAEWVEDNAADLLQKLAAAAPEAIALTKEEVIANRHLGCFDALRQHIAIKSSDAGRNRDQVDAGVVKNCDHALECIQEYEQVFLREHCVEGVKETDATTVSFRKLCDAIKSLEIDVVEKDGIVEWKDRSMDEAWDLGVAPGVQSKESVDGVYDRSGMLYHGESTGNYFVYAVIEHLREQEQQGIDRFGNSWVGVLMGNVFYCVNRQNFKDYFVLQADAVGELFSGNDWGEKARTVSATLGKSMVTMGLFSLSADILANAKRLAIGGGYMTFNPIKLRNPGQILINTVKSAMPGQSQYLMGRGIYRGMQDAKLFWDIRKTHGYWRARFVNTVLAKAGVRPEWIRTIENATKVSDLDLVSGYLGHGHAKEAQSFEELKKSLKKYIKEDLLHKARTRELTWKNWGKRILFGQETVSYEQVYQDVVDAYKAPAASGSKVSTTADDLARAGRKATTEVVESSDDAARVLRNIEEARIARNHKELGRLVTENEDLLRRAADAGDKAAGQALEASRFAKSSRLAKMGAGTLIGIGIAFDAYLLIENEREIAEAKKNNPGLVSTLEARRTSLVAAGGGGALLEAGMYTAGVSGGAGLVLAAPVVGGAIYSELVYDAIRDWEKSEQEYLREDSGTLLTTIQEKMTERTRGTAAAHGDTPAQWLWKKMPWYGGDRAAQHYQEKFDETDKGINLTQRQKLYTAYALKNARGENLTEMARLQNNYIAMVTHGVFDALPPQELSEAEIYASLTMLRALKEKEGQPQTIIYLSADGMEKTFNLSLFAFDGVPQTVEEKQRVSDAVAEYRNVVQPALLYTRFTLSMDYARSSDIHSDSLRASIRGDLVMRARHHLNKAEEYIRASDLSIHEKDIVRLELRKNFEDRVAAIVTEFEEGTIDPKQFSAALAKLEYVADEAKNFPREILARSSSPIKVAMGRKAPSRDRRTLGEDDPVQNAKRGEAKKLKIRNVSEALLELAA